MLIFVIIVLCILCLCILGRVLQDSNRGGRGTEGENYIKSLLARLGIKNILSNLYIPLKNGNTSEIDMLFINRKGIFVVECKNYSGKLYGSSDQKNWTKVYNTKNGKKKYSFYNPIKQNQGHIWALMRVLHLEEKLFHSLVIFTGNCDITNIEIRGKEKFTYIVHTDNIETLIKRMKSLPDIITSRDAHAIYNELSAYENSSFIEKQKHIRYCKSKQ